MKPAINWFFIFYTSAAALFAESLPVKATGVDVKTGEKIFTETGRSQYSDGYLRSAEIEFRGTDGKVYTRQKIRVNQFPAAPNYLLEDLRDGHGEGVMHSGSAFEVFFKNDAAAVAEKITLRIPQNGTPVVTFPGFTNFVLQHWSALLRGEPVYFYLIVPTQRDFYRFRVLRETLPGLADGDQVHFRIELQNMVLRMFADPIRISFDVRKKRLVQYEGIHFVRDLPKFLGRKLRVTYQID
ncbi:MAG: hypothetical protein J0L53_10975 [Spirochaetes bacterium]|nr:hypothetical protein [Spirochaetota bacterium]